MKFLGQTNIDFLGRRRTAFFASGVVILLGVVSLIARGGVKPGLDFSGGRLLQVKFQEQISVESIRETLAEVGL